MEGGGLVVMREVVFRFHRGQKKHDVTIVWAICSLVVMSMLSVVLIAFFCLGGLVRVWDAGILLF